MITGNLFSIFLLQKQNNKKEHMQTSVLISLKCSKYTLQTHNTLVRLLS